MPSNLHPLGALPARFRKPRLLLVGSGDVGARLVQQAQLWGSRWRIFAVVRRPEAVAHWRQLGCVPLVADLDQAHSLRRLAGMAQQVIHLAPPPPQGTQDHRTQHLLRALSLRSSPKALIYASTSGVYGDAKGQWVKETHVLNPQTLRAQRRVDAEKQIRHWGLRAAVRVSVFRVPGIHAQNREGSLQERLMRQAPVLCASQDIFTNHIHATDLARIFHWALWASRPQCCYNVNDKTDLRLGDALDELALHLGLAKPPRWTWEQAQANLSPMILSFWKESRRMDTSRLDAQWPWGLRYPRLIDAYKV